MVLARKPWRAGGVSPLRNGAANCHDSPQGPDVPRSPRRGFSLVELLVAMALIVFIMSILSAAFAAGSKAFRDLKAAGDNAERLRGAIVLLRSDLSASHFDGNRRLSDPNFWRHGPGPADYGPPPEGFFRLWQDAQPLATWPDLPGQVSEFTSVRSALHFSVRLPGKTVSDLFSTQLPTNIANPLLTLGGAEAIDQRFMDGVSPHFRSHWAEVAWWLTPAVDAAGQPEMTKPDGPQGNYVPQPLFVLRRRQLLMWSGGGPSLLGDIDVQPAAINDEISLRPGANGTARLNRPRDVTVPAFRWGMHYGTNNVRSYAGWPTVQPVAAPFVPNLNTYPAEVPAAMPAGRVEDIVLNNVLSMDVRVLLDKAPDFVTLFDPTVQPFGVRQMQNSTPPRNPNFNFGASPTGPLVFDTWSRWNIDGYDYENNWDPPANLPGNHGTIPLYQHFQTGQRLRIRALLITLRLWDQKSQQSRQVTLIQDM